MGAEYIFANGQNVYLPCTFSLKALEVAIPKKGRHEIQKTENHVKETIRKFQKDHQAAAAWRAASNN